MKQQSMDFYATLFGYSDKNLGRGREMGSRDLSPIRLISKLYIITSPPTFQKHIWSSWESLLVCQVAAKTSTLSMQMIKLVKILLCEK